MRANPYISRAAFCLMLLPMFLAGCSAGFFRNPFVQPDRTTYVTPHERTKQLQELADDAIGMDKADQKKHSLELATELKAERDPLLRRQLLRTLANFNTELAGEMLIAATSDENPRVRVVACEELGTRGGDGAIATLSRVAKDDSDDDVRLAALRGLGKLEGQAAIQGIQPALSDSDPAIQYRAMQSLKQITGHDFNNDVYAWREYLETGTPPEVERESIADRVQGVFWR